MRHTRPCCLCVEIQVQGARHYRALRSSVACGTRSSHVFARCAIHTVFKTIFRCYVPYMCKPPGVTYISPFLRQSARLTAISGKKLRPAKKRTERSFAFLFFRFSTFLDSSIDCATAAAGAGFDSLLPPVKSLFYRRLENIFITIVVKKNRRYV